MCKRTDTVKRLLSLLIAFVLTLSLSANKVQAISVPMLPYIPPSDVVQMDLLFNIFGLTKPAIEDDVKRLQGYWSLIEMVMGAGAEVTKNKIEQMFEDARTSRAWEIDPETISAMNRIATGALAQGIESGGTPSITQQAQIYQFVQQKLAVVNVQLSYEQFGNFATTANGKYGEGNWVLYILGAVWSTGNGQIALGAVSKNSSTPMYYFEKGGRYNSFGNAYLDNNQSVTNNYNSVCCQYGVNGNVAIMNNTYIDQYIRTNNIYGSTFSGTYINGTTKGNVTYAPVIAQNTQIADALEQGELIPITADTAILNGAIDDTKPARIHLPTSLPEPAENVADLPAVQEQLGVVPISDDVTETVAQLQKAVTESVGSASDYAIDLTQYFPFCLPFDIFRIIGAFIAEPEAPSFSYVIVNPFANDGEHNIELEIDLSIFDQVAEVLRTLESILFVVGLCVVTRSLYLRG